MARTSCDLCREKRAKCYGGNPCGRCQARNLDCRFTQHAWTSKCDLRNEITTQRERLHRREHILDAACATNGHGQHVIWILRCGGLSYDEAYQKVQCGNYTPEVDMDTASGQCSIKPGESETFWSPSTAHRDISSSAHGQSSVSSPDCAFTDDTIYQSTIASNQVVPDSNLLQWQMDPIQSIPWTEPTLEVNIAATSYAQACHHQIRTNSGEETGTSSSTAAKMQQPRTRRTDKTARKRQKPQEQAEATNYAKLDQSSIVEGMQRTQDAKRERSASSECRLREHDDISKLASLEQTMNVQNRKLSEHFYALRAEIYTLNALLVQHTNCNCVLIQSYIANEAEKSMMNLLGGPGAPPSSSAQT